MKLIDFSARSRVWTSYRISQRSASPRVIRPSSQRRAPSMRAIDRESIASRTSV